MAQKPNELPESRPPKPLLYLLRFAPHILVIVASFYVAIGYAQADFVLRLFIFAVLGLLAASGACVPLLVYRFILRPRARLLTMILATGVDGVTASYVVFVTFERNLPSVPLVSAIATACSLSMTHAILALASGDEPAFEPRNEKLD